MIKKTLQYVDVDGKSHVDDFYFNLSKAELAEWKLTSEEDLEVLLTRVSKATNNGRLVIDTFKDILRRAYGVRSEDGKRLMKSPQLFQEFQETDAYSELFMELVTNADAAATFIRGVIPADIQVDSDSNSVAMVAHVIEEMDTAENAYSPMSEEDIQESMRRFRDENPGVPESFVRNIVLQKK